MKTVAIYGCGAIGTVLAKYVDQEGFAEIVGIYDKYPQATAALKSKLTNQNPVATSTLDELLDLNPDIVIEASSPKALIDNYEKILEKSSLMLMCTGTLFRLYDKLDALVKKTGHEVYAPSGAIAGIDAIKSAEAGGIDEVTITTSKNPRSLEQTDYITKKDIILAELTEPTVIFEGPAEEVVKIFPKNTNVTATLAYAANAPVHVKLIADPTIQTNQHEIYAKGAFGELYTRVRNVPSPDNPKTSYLAALSAAKTLKQIMGGIRIGT